MESIIWETLAGAVSQKKKKKNHPAVLLSMTFNKQSAQPAVTFKLCEAFITLGGILGSNFWTVLCTVVSSSCKISYFHKVIYTTYPHSAVNHHPRASVPHKKKSQKEAVIQLEQPGKKTIMYNLKRLFCRHLQMSFPQKIVHRHHHPPPTAQRQMVHSHQTAYMGWSEVGQMMALVVQRSTGGKTCLQ